MDWKPVVPQIQADLRSEEDARDAALGHAHSVVAGCRRSIASVHRGDVDAAHREYTGARELLSKTESTLSDHPRILHGGILRAARQELAEAAIVLAHAADEDTPPTPDDVGVPPPRYAEGLGDAIGEFRRMALAALANEDVAGATTHLGAMEAAYEALQQLETARGVADVKRQKDVARSLLDRTLGEVTIGRAAARLSEATRDTNQKR